MHAIDAEGRLDDYSVLGILFRTDAAGMLNEADVSRLDAALEEANWAYVGLGEFPVGPLAHVLEDPVSAVRVAYVLARDLAEVDFDADDDSTADDD